MKHLNDVIRSLSAGELDNTGAVRALTALFAGGEASAGEITAELAAADISSSRRDEILNALSLDKTVLLQDDATLMSGVAEFDDDATRILSAGKSGIQADIGYTVEADSRADPPAGKSRQQTPLGVGSVIKERFVLEAEIGKGGMGSVYRARDLRKEEAQDQQTDVAIKLINEEFQNHPDAMVALQREAKKAQTLAHPNIVTVYDFDRDGATVYMSMAYLRGAPLDQVIGAADDQLAAPAKALDIILQMSRGLSYAHEKGFAHADFKPGNVFITEQGEAKILDFGIARAAARATAGSGEAQGDHTRFDPASLGAITPAYASSEMLEGQAPIPADDVYALACVAFELITGRHPFRDDNGRKLTALEAAAKNLRAPVDKKIPRRFQRAITRGLAFRREQRFADATAFLQAIRPPAKTRRSILVATLVLAVAASMSWYVVYQKSDIAITVENLSPSLNESKNLIAEGNEHLHRGDYEQAHKAFAQAWETGRNAADVDSRERSRLKVVVDRRVDAVIDHFIAESRRVDTDSFSQEVLLLSLESLGQSELGTRDEQITAAVRALEARLGH